MIRYVARWLSSLGCEGRCCECGATERLVTFGGGSRFTTTGEVFVCAACLNKAVELVCGTSVRWLAGEQAR